MLNDSCIERILSQWLELWIHLLPETVYMHVATVNWVCVADYRRVTVRMLQLAEVHYSVCVSQDEFKHWRERYQPAGHGLPYRLQTGNARRSG
ncbi:hypothetical protein SME20J_35560 [Serratia marcescens]|nr:hypothetical protein SME20J_35560 [Serratia marcescens]